jgi:hypothetical protein
MPEAVDLDMLRARAQGALTRLAGVTGADDLTEAKALVESLRNVREYEWMGRLAEAVSRQDPDDARNRRLYAQFLIDTGRATVALDVLRVLSRRLPATHAERAEVTGLLGRAHKQIFFDAGDKTTASAREALKQAVAAYRGPFEENASNTWHGINLLALLTRARRLGVRVAGSLDPRDVARRLLTTLDATPIADRDDWFWPTRAEASLGLGDWDGVEASLRMYVADEQARAFQVASTLRQFTEIWDLERTDARGRDLVNMLRARLAGLPGGSLDLSVEQLQQVRAAASPSSEQLEAVLGTEGTRTYQWWKTGLDRAVAVAAIRARLGGRIGTGFLVRGADLGLATGDELLVVTNSHVVNALGAAPGIRPDDAEVAFEAVDGAAIYPVDRIVWTSPVDRHDATILRLGRPPADIAPMPIARALPVLDEGPRVYVIGHPGGRELAFSFQDNELIDHEGPPAGRPPTPGVCRVHYRAPTEGGSSGSPVFNAGLWQVVALHHKGGRIGMPCLNGKPGTYGANEGISILSIAEAIRQT